MRLISCANGRCFTCCGIFVALSAVVLGGLMHLKKTSFDDYQDMTPLGAAVTRIVEAQHEPASERLVGDVYALKLLPASPARPGVQAMQWLLQKFGSTFESLVLWKPGGEAFLLWLGACRTQLIDDVLAQAIKDGAKQVVVLGAGYDSRGIRLAQEGVIFFEVDRPQVQEQKKWSLSQLPAGPRPKMVSVDFATQKLKDRLLSQGFNADVKSVFVMEGVAQYIPRAGLLETLSFVGGLKNATITFTYVHQDVFDNPAALEENMPLSAIEELVQKAKNAKEPWIMGYRPSEFPSLLAGVGLMLFSDEGWSECRNRHLLAKGRTGIPVKMERLITATTGK